MSIRAGDIRMFNNARVTVEGGPDARYKRGLGWYIVRYDAGAIEIVHESALFLPAPCEGDMVTCDHRGADGDTWTVYMIDEKYVVLTLDGVVVVRHRGAFDRDWRLK